MGCAPEMRKCAEEARLVWEGAGTEWKDGEVGGAPADGRLGLYCVSMRQFLLSVLQ